MNTRANRRSEKWLERALQDFVTRNGGAAIKMPTSEINGLPDQLVLWPGGIAEFVEVKSTGKKQSDIQCAVTESLIQLGFRYTVIDSEIKLQQWQTCR